MKANYIILVLVMIFCFSCKKEIDTSPQLPSIETFVDDFSYFQSNKKTLESQNNWNYASKNVSVWRSLIMDSLSIPVMAYAEAIKTQSPVYQGDDTWLREYSFNDKKNVFTAKLFAVVDNNSINWEMFISKDGEYDDFKWFTGTSLIDESKVSWIIYKNPDEAVKFLSVEYTNDNDNTKSIIYQKVMLDDSKNGNYIKYGLEINEDFNSFCNIYTKALDNLSQIQWNNINKKGRIKDEVKFHDNDWYCWNENKEDIDCD